MKESILIGADNPLIKNHRVYGLPVFPGLAYIDLLYQVFRENRFDYATLDLRRLTICNPLVVDRGVGIRLEIECKEDAEGLWRIRVEGRPEGCGKETAAIRYVSAELRRREAAAFAETLDLDAARREAKQVFDLDEIYGRCRQRQLVHTGFMKAEGVVYDLGTELVADVFVGPAACAGAEGFMFHPVLLDGSAIGVWGASALFNEEQRLFLPLAYESFRASALFNKRCVVKVRKSSLVRSKEVSFATMEIFDEAGQKTGELLNYAGKLVRDAGLFTPGTSVTQQRGRRGFLLSCFKRPNKKVVEKGAGGGAETGTAETFLKRLLAERLDVPPESIDARTGYYELGLDSAGLLEIVREIEKKAGEDLSPTLLFEYTNIAELSSYLEDNFPAVFADRGFPGLLPPNSETGSMPTECKNGASYVQRGDVGDIAIIGMAGRYPGAGNLREFWKNLREGKESFTEVPKDRGDWGLLEGIELPSGKRVPTWGGFIADPFCFDHEFFRLSPRQAQEIDPRERLVLEICWETIEDAGYTPGTLAAGEWRKRKRPVGVFIGAMHNDYLLIAAEEVGRGRLFPLPMSSASLANRISYFFDFHGPSITLDTMCSSSLTAVHLAVESLRRGECRVALAGGVNLSLHPYKYMTYGLMEVLASGARCHPFGMAGDGYLPAEGVGLVLLKPLLQAEQDRDHIYAVIKGSAANHGGAASGFTAPNLPALVDLIASCLEDSGIDPRTVGCVEAAANGSAMGDAVEFAALARAYRKFTTDEQFCAIGSVKGNIGHAEAAAGMSQLCKAVLQLHYRELVPTLNAEPLNPEISFKGTPFYLQTTLRRWKRPVIKVNGERREFPRRAAINSLGAGGSNVHLILEEYDTKRAGSPAGPAGVPQVVVISARNRERLRAYVQQLLGFIEEQSGFSMADLAYTLQVGREAMSCRLALVVKRREELMRGLKAFLKDAAGDGSEAGIPIFSGECGNMPVDFRDPGKSEGNRWFFRTAKDLEELARYWVQGGGVNWEALHEGGTAGRMSLPTYPFAKVHCGLQPDKGSRVPVRAKESMAAPRPEKSIRQSIAGFLCQELGLAREQISWDRDLAEYGLDSIIALKLMRHIEKTFGLKLTRREMIEHRTIDSMAGLLAAKAGETGSPARGEEGRDKVSESLEGFRQGLLSLEEMEDILEEIIDKQKTPKLTENRKRLI